MDFTIEKLPNLPLAAHWKNLTDPDRYDRRWSTWRAVKRFPAAGVFRRRVEP